MEYFYLNNGVRIPVLGFGVSQIREGDCERCVSDAIELGYRSFDTAQSYLNEKQVGKAIKKSSIKREEFFVTTKIWVTNYGEEKTKESVYKSLEKLNTDYLDLVLVHQPFADYYSTYKMLEKFYEQGLIKAIGVSNFYPDRLVDIASNFKTVPAVNQVETHVLNQQKEGLLWAKKLGIQMVAWSPFARRKHNLFENKIIKNIAKKHKKSTAQVMLRWNIQRGIVVLPKTIHKERMKENLNVFDFTLSQEDMKKISALDTEKSVFFSHRDPKVAEYFGNLLPKAKKGNKL